MSCKTLCMLAATIGTAWAVEAGEIVPAEIRGGVSYPLVIVAYQPADLNILPAEQAAVTFAQDARNIRITVPPRQRAKQCPACWWADRTTDWKTPTLWQP